MELNEITLLGKKYIIIDVLDSIAIPDCFVHGNNKLDCQRGNGEAKLYVGPRQTIEKQLFFRKTQMHGFLLKRDLLEYLQDAKFEYENQEQIYRNNISDYWLDNNKKVNNLEDNLLFFNFVESPAGGEKRFYITSYRGDIFYDLFRKIVLPEITYISILKLKNLEGEEVFYFRPYLNYFFDSRHHSEIIAEKEKEIQQDTTIQEDKKKEVLYARKGQGKYRLGLIDEMRECLITGVNDERMLIASHIKPWAVCENDEERVDKYNGLLLIPTYDRLFDQGFISFSNDGVIYVSPYLSPLNIKRLGLIPNKKYNLQVHSKRSFYLEYHRQNIFKKG